MDKKKAMQLLEGLHNGTIGTIEYVSNVPVKAASKKEGYSILKYTRKFVRWGAAYKNLVKDQTPAGSTRANNYSWVIENKLSYNSSTNLEYVRVSNINKKKLDGFYLLQKDDETIKVFDHLHDLEEYLTPSTLNGNGSYEAPVVQNIKLDNVLAINGVM